MKKKLIGIILVFIVVFVSVFSFATEAFRDIRVYSSDIKVFNGPEEIQFSYESFIYNNRLYVPFREMVQSLNYNVAWNGDTREVHIKKNPPFIPPLNPFVGEFFIYGQVMKLDRENRVMVIEQHYDDNSRDVNSSLYVLEDAIIVISRKGHEMIIPFEDIRVGDVIGGILTKDEKVRAVIIDV